MDVTQEIRNNHIIYGASDYNNPNRFAAGKSLNYANGPSITRPDHERVTIIPYTLKYQDSVGLFGAENYFVKVTVRLDESVALACFEEEGFECGTVAKGRSVEDVGYAPGIVDRAYDVPIDSDEYLQAQFKINSLPDLGIGSVLSVDLNNLKTGNQYIDSWLDVRLYTKEREEWPYDKAYILKNSEFYIGFHARNTRRLEYNVECVLGLEYMPSGAVSDPRLIMR